MRWQLWTMAAIIIVASYTAQTYAQSGLKNEILEKMLRASDIIVEGKFSNLENGGKLHVSEVFQGIQRAKTLKLSLSAEENYIYLFSAPGHARDFQGGVSENLHEMFKKQGHSLDSGILETTKKRKVVSNVTVSQKNSVQWIIDNTVTIMSLSPGQNKHVISKTYLVTLSDGTLKVYSPLEQSERYIFFLKRDSSGFSLAPFPYSIIKSNLFISAKIREMAVKWRGERSDIVVLATVESSLEEENKGNVFINARCKNIRVFKGNIPTQFDLKYIRRRRAYPPMVILFDNLNYVFFLKKPNKGEKHYRLLNSYEGAYSEKRYLLKDVEGHVKNRFDSMAGKKVSGLQTFASMPKTEIARNEPAIVRVMLVNISQKKLEIYHNQIAYFTLFHIIDGSGKVIAAKYPKVVSVPPIQRRFFVNLEPGGYIVVPPFNLRDYCNLKPGNYSIYVEFHLPWEYAGKTMGKSAWSGQMISNKIELTIKK